MRLIYALYQSGLERYRRRDNSFFREAINLVVRFLSWRRGMAFPDRKIGGWYWVERIRFEFLMEWLEFDEVRLCRKLIRPGMTVIDIGAHIGYYTMLFSRLVGPKGRVFAFEANPDNFETARANLRSARCANVEIFPFGVCDKTGPRLLHVSPGNSNHSFMEGFTEAESTIEVSCVALDDFLAERKIAQVDFIKSDTEGAERLVIEGALRTLGAAPKLAMLVEYNPKAIECGGTPATELLRTLGDLGFDCTAVMPGGKLQELPELSGSEYVNLLCRKRSR